LGTFDEDLKEKWSSICSFNQDELFSNCARNRFGGGFRTNAERFRNKINARNHDGKLTNGNTK